MKTIGLIGGTTWVSTADYYRVINQEVNKRLGGLNSAQILLYSVNFEEFRPPSDPSDWGEVGEKLTAIALRLEAAGAECLLLCANTPHLFAGDIRKKLRVPLIHIAEETSKAIEARQISTVALLGTKFTMELPFFREKLRERKIEALIPDADDREFIHASIFNELGREIFLPETKKRYLSIIDRLAQRGAGGVIFGCTEIPLLLKQEDCRIPAFDTTVIHAMAAVGFALNDEFRPRPR